MVAEVFLDSNVLIYAAYPKQDETWKRKIAFNLIQAEDYAISTQVMLEFLNVTTRKRKPGLKLEVAKEWLVDLGTTAVIGADENLVLEAIELSQRYKIVFWDGMIIAAANRAGARTLFTEDLNHGQKYGEVEVINPFKNLPN
ncbi:MAG: PIN domain-containing protein [Sphingomonadaceae bacterium]